MLRGNYKVSEETCRRLLMAAGELFACHGIESVTVREITAKAGTKPNAISYHFGGKDGLVDAVWNYCLQRWDNNHLETYLKENERLLETRDGQRQLITDAVDIFYSNLHAEDQPMWVNRFIMRSIITAQGIERMKKVFAEHLISLFCSLFEHITGNNDRLTALSWTMNIISPGSYLTASGTDFLTFTPIEKIDYAFLRRQQAVVTRNALFAAGLDD